MITKQILTLTTLLILTTLPLSSTSTLTEPKFTTLIQNSKHESDAIKIINDAIYDNLNLTSTQTLKLLNSRHWINAIKLLVEFGYDKTNTEVRSEISNIISESNSYTKLIRSGIASKKKNIVKLSPIFEWSQDNDYVKIRLKFAKNLESPGDKGIQKFKVICQRNFLIVHGYKPHEDYVTYYYRKVHLYDFMKQHTCSVYKETEGTYIIRFLKNQATLYWNELNQLGDDHTNMYTWFDVFKTYDDKSKYTEFREFANDNLLDKDINDYVQDKREEKKQRLLRIQRLVNYFKTKGYDIKNFCNTPVGGKSCYLVDYRNWNYWME